MLSFSVIPRLFVKCLIDILYWLDSDNLILATRYGSGWIDWVGLNSYYNIILVCSCCHAHAWSICHNAWCYFCFNVACWIWLYPIARNTSRVDGTWNPYIGLFRIQFLTWRSGISLLHHWAATIDDPFLDYITTWLLWEVSFELLQTTGTCSDSWCRRDPLVDSWALAPMEQSKRYRFGENGNFVIGVNEPRPFFRLKWTV